jgi:hypothetical protein
MTSASSSLAVSMPGSLFLSSPQDIKNAKKKSIKNLKNFIGKSRFIDSLG